MYLAFGVDDLLGEHSGAVQIQVGVEMLLAEGIDETGKALWDMAVAKGLAHHGAVFALGQGVVIALARARLGLLGVELLQQGGHRFVDVFPPLSE